MRNSMQKRILKYMKLHWLKVTLISVAVLLIITITILTIIGFKAFSQLEPFYRKSMVAGIPLNIFFYLIVGSLTAAIHTGLFVYFIWGGGMEKLKSRKIKPQKVNVKWKDIVGMKSVQKEVWEVIQLLNDRKRIKRIGGKIVKGVLMIGPPGCGKTYLAKAIATETKLPFLHTTGSEFQGMFIGVGTNRIKKLFKEARINAELEGGCIVFIDEIDTIATPRVNVGGGRAGQDFNATANQLLTELDGLDTDKDNIIVIAATNVGESELDTALMRPGRFDRKVYVGLPGLEDRKEILKYYFNKVSYDKNKVDFSRLARLTVGNSPADISNITREASLIAVRKHKEKVDMSDVQEAMERIEIGIKSEYTLSPQDKKIVAYHEAGHAVTTYLLVHTQDVFKASIIPRRGTAGTIWKGEKEERYVPDKEYLLSEIKGLLGGFAAEKIRFGTTSSGVADDLQKANRIAHKMATQWGMGTAGPNLAETRGGSQVAEDDKEGIINDCLNEVNEVLRREKPILDEIAQRLLKEEELNYDQIEAVFKKHGKSRMTYLMEGIRKRKKEGLSWNDVVGMSDVKEEAKEIVSLIQDRVKLKQVGGQIIRGLIMFGPPGCGKTYLASAMANEAGLPFITRAGSEFNERWVGTGSANIRHLFQEAREKALAKGGCIIFIDEIDAVASKRIAAQGGGGAQTGYNQTTNQLLVELDGLKEKDARYNIVVIGATNMKEKFLDPAVLRPGRFDRKLYIDLPALDDRKKLLTYYLSKVKYNHEEINIDKFAKMTPRSSPADISNLIREAALLAVRNKKTLIGIKEIEEARERIALGLRRNIRQTKEVLTKTAYHETGHVMANYFFSKKSFPFKVSIIPRRGTLGVAWHAFEGDDYSGNEDELRAWIMGCLGGYMAEKVKFGKHQTGVSQDFNYAMRIAHQMVWRFGMGKSGFIGDFYALFEEGYRNQNMISEKMKSALDFEVQEILKECAAGVESMLKRESELFEHFAKKLIAKEELNYSEIESIFKKYAKEKIPKTSD